jgi:hypothetical protein
LTSDYERLRQLHAEADHQLAAVAGTPDLREYINLRKAAAEARIDSELARLALEQHRRRHSQAN